jgi:pimeloyl-ACP methyl ester carboxylesterase
VSIRSPLFRSGPRASRLAALTRLFVRTGAFSADAGGSRDAPSDAKPTIVLVHGAFADAASWTGVAERLQREGYTVVAPANPLRGLTADSAYLTSLVRQIDAPVLLVGHSYGGAVITNADAVSNVIGLVYVAAFAPEEGERLGEVEDGSRDSVLNSALVPFQYPTGQGDETATEFAINPARLREVFAADLPEEQAAVMAATQRPIAAGAFSDLSGAAAWKRLPSWAVVATGDKAAGADVVRSMAQRAGADITEIDGSHVIMVSHPQEVTDVVLKAVRATS